MKVPLYILFNIIYFMSKKNIHHSNFDLQFLLKVGQQYNINKNGLVQNIYQDNFEQVTLEDESSNQMEKQIQFQFQEEEAYQQPEYQFKGNMLFPVNQIKKDNSKPNISLKLRFINGYNCLESNQNVFYLQHEKILFNSSKLGVIMDIQMREQSYFGAIEQQLKQNEEIQKKYHKNSIISIAYDQQKKIVATGSLGSNPQICIWNAVTLQPIIKFYQGKNTKAISLIKFFMRTKYVITIDRQSKKQNNLRIWSIKGKKIHNYKTHGAVYGIATSQNKIALATIRGAFILQYDEFNNNLIETRLSHQFHTCAAFLDDIPIFCNTFGEVFYNKQKKKINQGFIFAIAIKDRKIYTSGSTDFELKVFDQKFQLLKSYKLQNYARSIDILNNKILLSIRKGKIVQIQQNGEIKTILNTHFAGEVWGLCYNQKYQTFISAGDDNKILHFRINQNSVIREDFISHQQKSNKKYQKNILNSFPCSQQSRTIECFGKNFVYVTNYGELFVKYIKQEDQQQNNHTINPILLKDKSECMKFSDDGKLLAIGCHNQSIYIFQIQYDNHQRIINLKQKNILYGHDSYIISLDFNSDGTFLRSCGNFGELRYWDLSQLKQVSISRKHTSPQIKQKIRNMKWSSTGKFTSQINQIWKQMKDIFFINKVNRSNDDKYLAVGEDENFIRIYRNPAISNKFIKIRGHSHHILNVCWSSDNKYLASVGGYDKCLMIWEVVTI